MLIIQSNGISAIELPDLYNTDADDYAKKPAITRDTLECLWDTTGGHILNPPVTLGALTTPLAILTGALSALPHSCGRLSLPGLD